MKLKKLVYSAPLIWLSIFLVYLLLSFPFIVLNKEIGSISITMRVTALFLSFSLLIFVWIGFTKSKLIEKNYFVLIFLGIAVILQLIIVFYLKIQPTNDLLYLHDEAISIVKHKHEISLTNFRNYFAQYPNNYGYLAVIYTWYKIVTFLGIGTKYLVAAGNVLNILMINGGILLGYYVIRVLKTCRLANLFLFFFLLNPWTYLSVPYYYTHTASFFILMLVIACMLIIKKANSGWKKIIFCILEGFILYWGIKVRITNIFPIIALIFVFFVFGDKSNINLRKIIFSGALMLCGILAGGCFFQGAFGDIMPKNNKNSFPITHWLMMASHGDGRFNREDVWFTSSFKTKKEKQDANIKRIIKNYQKAGIRGTAKLVGIKLRSVWLIGDDDASKMLVSAPDYTRLHDFISGPDNGGLLMYCYLFRSLTLLFMLLNVLYLLKKPDSWNYLIALILLGAMVFHCVWEANPKYSICFMGLMAYSAIMGYDGWKNKKDNKLSFSKKSLIIYLVCAVCVAVMLNIRYDIFSIRSHKNNKYYAAAQMKGSHTREITAQRGDILSQTFQTSRDFNTIDLNILFSKGKFQIRLLDERGQILQKKEIYPNTDESHFTWKLLKGVMPKGQKGYCISVICLSNGSQLRVPVYQTGNYDAYPKGNMIWREREFKNTDIIFGVYQRNRK